MDTTNKIPITNAQRIKCCRDLVKEAYEYLSEMQDTSDIKLAEVIGWRLADTLGIIGERLENVEGIHKPTGRGFMIKKVDNVK